MESKERDRVKFVLSYGSYSKLKLQKLYLLKVSTNVAMWTKLTNLKMYYFDASAQPTRINVFFLF